MSERNCQAPRRDDTRCPHPATVITIHQGSPVATCGQHPPDRYSLYSHQGYSPFPAEAFGPEWLDAFIEAWRDYAIKKRRSAQDARDKARWLEAEASEADKNADALRPPPPALAASEARPGLREEATHTWTTDLPTGPGWYWYWQEGQTDPIALIVFEHEGKLEAGRRGPITEYEAGYWQGPLALPMKPLVIK